MRISSSRKRVDLNRNYGKTELRMLSGLLCGLILWGSSTPARSLDFTDALFLAVSAMTEVRRTDKCLVGLSLLNGNRRD